MSSRDHVLGVSVGDCQNCRRRRRPCGREFPTCAECLRRGLHCRTLLPRSGVAAWRGGSTSAPAPATGTILDVNSTFQTSDALSRTQHGQNVSVAPDNQVAIATTTNPALPASLDIAAFQDDIQLSWLLQHYVHRPVLRDVILLSVNNGLGEAAATAAKVMAATMFAKFQKLPFEATSTFPTPYARDYGRAIQALQKQISSFRSELLEAALVPALLLFITEFWVTGRSQEHYAGLEQLLKVSWHPGLQGNRMELLGEARLAMVWYAISRGERTIFGEESWKIASIVPIHSPRTSSDYLVEYMADISGLFADTKNINSTSQGCSRQESAIRARAQAILHQLYSWRWSWEARNRGRVSEKPTPDANVFGTIFSFDNPQLLYEIWLYDALLILVLSYLDHRDHSNRWHEPIRPAGGLITPDQMISVQQPAIEICRSLDYQMLNFTTLARAHQFALPVALAYVTLPPTSPISAWILSKIDAAPRRLGVPWSIYISRLQCPDPSFSWGMYHDSTRGNT